MSADDTTTAVSPEPAGAAESPEQPTPQCTSCHGIGKPVEAAVGRLLELFGKGTSDVAKDIQLVLAALDEHHQS